MGEIGSYLLIGFILSEQNQQISNGKKKSELILE